MTTPFPEVSSGQIEAANVSVAPDGTQYVVPSGMHERLRQAVVPNPGEQSRDPKVDLAVAGWASLHTDGMTGRVYVDAPDDFAKADIVKRFARSHDAGSIMIAHHPSGDVRRWSRPAAVSLVKE